MLSLAATPTPASLLSPLPSLFFFNQFFLKGTALTSQALQRSVAAGPTSPSQCALARPPPSPRGHPHATCLSQRPVPWLATPRGPPQAPFPSSRKRHPRCPPRSPFRPYTFPGYLLGTHSSDNMYILVTPTRASNPDLPEHPSPSCVCGVSI